MNNSQLKQLLDSYRQRFEDKLHFFLPLSSTIPSRLHEAMRYSSVDAGKRIRPFLVYATGKALDVPIEQLDYPAVAIELIHNYSLVHDDMPAMDDDELRRGKPTCHLHYDEATALLVGDALQSQAFEVLSSAGNIAAEKLVKIIHLLAVASGSKGMAGGQAIDLDSVGERLNFSSLQQMHELKTGALIRASVKMATVLADNTKIKVDDYQNKLENYAKCLGLAFQIQDDVLDIESDTQTLGKPQGSDQAHNKPTYPSLIGLEESKNMAKKMVADALDNIKEFDHHADPLRWLAEYVVQRNY
ncbi:MAG: polyprenyl synthetase family protein [Gammaproteobacteria bacterium]|nr:polyprenyl synthetase family protein [Gammaproteobacteria bacterium]